jgi:hypothetical protein
MIGMPAEIYLLFTDFKHSFLKYRTVTGVAKCKSNIITTVRCAAVVLSVCSHKYLCPGTSFHASKSTDSHRLSLSYAWIVVCVLFMFLFHRMHRQQCLYVFATRTFILNGDINVMEILPGNIKTLNTTDCCWGCVLSYFHGPWRICNKYWVWLYMLLFFFNCCSTVHFDKYKLSPPTNALFIKT